MEWRTGNIYGYTDEWQSWQPRFDWIKQQAGQRLR